MHGTIKIVNNTNGQMKASLKYDTFFRLYHGEEVKVDLSSSNQVNRFIIQVETVGQNVAGLIMTLGLVGGTLVSSSTTTGTTVAILEYTVRGPIAVITLTATMA